MTTFGFPTFARELLDARAALTIVDEIGLALRAHRRELGLSQRAYALRRGYARSTFARLEASAGSARLDEVVTALEGTGFGLYLGVVESPPPDSGPDDAGAGLSVPQGPTTPESGSPVSIRALPDRPDPVPVSRWPRPELVARVRGGSRRFPGHRTTRQVTSPPMWWWMHEYFTGRGTPPNWYSPMV